MDGTVSTRTDAIGSHPIEGDRALLALIADTGIQIVVREVAPERLAAVGRRFMVTDDEGSPALHQATLDGDGYLYHPLTGEPVAAAATTALDGARAAAAFANEWLPFPYLRHRTTGAEFDVDAGAVFEAGPTNWVRVLLSPRTSDGEVTAWRIVLAFDTTVVQEGGRAASAAPSAADVTTASRFGSATAIEDVAELVSEAWVDDWLSQAYAVQRTREPRETILSSAEPAELGELAHLATYLTLLAAVAETADLPDIVLLPAGGEQGVLETVPVDLLIDMGLLETTALLVEPAPPGEASATASAGRITPLTLLDFGEPWRRHASPFSSRLELARTTFGSEAFSRWSGRVDAFQWPSLARLGGEAERLATSAPIDEAMTGITAPALYLWDGEPTAAVWRSASDAHGRRGAMLSGPLLSLLDESGAPLGGQTAKAGVTKPRFPRGALVTQALVELVLQAVTAANVPSHRAVGIRPMAARRIRRLLLSVPTALCDADRGLLQQRAEAAIQLVWRASGWHGRRDLGRPPSVALVHERATNVQVAHLWREIGGRFRGRAREYLDLVGKQRPGHGAARSLRICSIEVGDTSSGVAVVSWEMVEPAALLATHQVLAGLPLGSDLVRHAVVEQLIAPGLLAHAEAVAGEEGAELFRDVLAPKAKTGPRLRQCGRRLARDLLSVLAQRVLAEARRLERGPVDGRIVRSVRDLLGADEAAAHAPIAELDAMAMDAGLESLALGDAVLDIAKARLAEIVSQTIAPSIAAVQKVARALDCDLILLAGEADTVPGLRAGLMAGMPVRPDRLLVLDGGDLGQMPLAARHEPAPGLAASALGLLIAAEPQPKIGPLSLVVRPPDTPTVEQRLGPVDSAGLLRKDNILRRAKEANDRRGDAPGTTHVVLEGELPVTLHARRVPLESWPPLPAYTLNRIGPRKGKAPRGPLKIALAVRPANGGVHDEPAVVWARDTEGNMLAAGEVAVVRRSLAAGEHWLEGGPLAVGPVGEEEHDDV
jgi:hypothetical protein